jgi:hypothetical protein
LLNTAKKTDYLWERTGGCKLIDTKNTSVPDHFLPPKDRGDEEKDTFIRNDRKRKKKHKVHKKRKKRKGSGEKNDE